MHVSRARVSCGLSPGPTRDVCPDRRLVARSKDGVALWENESWMESAAPALAVCGIHSERLRDPENFPPACRAEVFPLGRALDFATLRIRVAKYSKRLIGNHRRLG